MNNKAYSERQIKIKNGKIKGGVREYSSSLKTPTDPQLESYSKENFKN